MSLYDEVQKHNRQNQRAYIESQQSKGIKCPHCKELIMVLVKNPKTGKMDACPVCGKKVR